MKRLALLLLITASVSGCCYDSIGCCPNASIQYAYTTSYCCGGCGCGSGNW